MNNIIEKGTENPLEDVNFDTLAKIMIDSWAYLVKHNPSAEYKIGEPKQFFDNNFMIPCEITINGDTRQSYAAIKSSYPTANDIEASQHCALIKCMAMFKDFAKVEKELFEDDIPF